MPKNASKFDLDLQSRANSGVSYLVKAKLHGASRNARDSVQVSLARHRDSRCTDGARMMAQLWRSPLSFIMS
jgi:hypothetical protein